MKFCQYILVFIFSVFLSYSVYSQENRLDKIQAQLDSLSEHVSVLNDSIDISVSNVSVQEFLRGIALANNVNISIANGLNETVVNNFNSVKFKDILLYLVKEYDLDIELLGNIIVVKKFIAPKAPQKEYTPKEISIRKTADNLYTVDLQNDTLKFVAKQLAQISKKNIIVRSEIRDVRVSCFVQNQTVQGVVEHIALSNDLEIESVDENTIILSAQAQVSSHSSSKRSRNSRSAKKEDYSFSFQILSKTDKTISINSYQAPLDTVVRTIADALEIEYYKLSEFDSQVTIVANDINFQDLLDVIYKGTKYSYKNLHGIYLLGEEQTSGMQETKLIQLEYRTVEKLHEVFPKQLQNGLEVIEFEELNSLLVTGSPEKVIEFEKFIASIDKTVPVVLIEVIIIDVLKSNTITTGINAGKGVVPESTGTLLPGVDVSFDSRSINRLLNSFNGFGWFSVGEVSSDFYLQLQALEESGVIKVRSTPKLSTLNGHEASLTSGETRYYVEEKSSVISNTAIQQTNTRQYKSVNADLSIKIKPIVSGNNQITLNIEVSQSDFKESEVTGAPPNSINRDFMSVIRVKDGEMVLLGGLERNESANTGKGTPGLSRVPVIKWFFSSRKKSKSNSKLDIFIKPTVIY